MPIKIRTFEDSTGAMMSVLIDDNNQPLFWPNVFATTNYRRGSSKTLSDVLRAIGMFELWSSVDGRTGSMDLASGQTFEMHEAESLSGFLCLKRPAQDEDVKISIGQAQKKITRLEKVRKSENQLDLENSYATRVESANRIRWVAKYLDYLCNKGVTALKDSGDRKSFESMTKRAIDRLRDRAPRGGSYAFNPSLVGIDKEQINYISEVLNPANKSPLNPFKTDFLKARNYFIWRLAVDTGMRRQELMELRCDDIDINSFRVSIRVSKTTPRTVPIGQATADAFYEFIMNHWSKVSSDTTKHGYAVIAQTGSHLKVDTLNAIINCIRSKIPGAPDYLTPHTLRRTWNEQFNELIDSIPLEKRPSPPEETRIRNQLQGWSTESQMGARYAARHINRKADELAETLASKLSKSEGEPHV